MLVAVIRLLRRHGSRARMGRLAVGCGITAIGLLGLRRLLGILVGALARCRRHGTGRS